MRDGDGWTRCSRGHTHWGVHGAAGLSQDTFLASAYAGIRTLRFADGPDEVHKNALAKSELRRQREKR